MWRWQKEESGFRFDLQGTFGLSQTAFDLDKAYQDLLDQERVNLRIRIPIADWGKSQSRMEIAQSNLELERMIIDQDKVKFERDVLIQVEQFRTN